MEWRENKEGRYEMETKTGNGKKRVAKAGEVKDDKEEEDQGNVEGEK